MLILHSLVEMDGKSKDSTSVSIVGVLAEIFTLTDVKVKMQNHSKRRENKRTDDSISGRGLDRLKCESIDRFLCWAGLFGWVLFKELADYRWWLERG